MLTFQPLCWTSIDRPFCLVYNWILKAKLGKHLPCDGPQTDQYAAWVHMP